MDYYEVTQVYLEFYNSESGKMWSQGLVRNQYCSLTQIGWKEATDSSDIVSPTQGWLPMCMTLTVIKVISLTALQRTPHSLSNSVEMDIPNTHHISVNIADHSIKRQFTKSIDIDGTLIVILIRH